LARQAYRHRHRQNVQGVRNRGWCHGIAERRCISASQPSGNELYGNRASPQTPMRKILSKILFCDEYDLNNVLLHIPVGIITVLIGIFSGWIGLVFGLGFITYELSERKILQDKAYPDIQGWLWGIGLLSIILLIVR